MPSEPEPARPRRRLPVIALAGLLLASTVALGLWLAARRVEALPVYWELPDFSLLDQQGRTLTRADLAGSPWIAGFIFTRCGGACPAMTARMARLAPRLPAGARLVSITVDPTHDTPAVLARYARDFEAGTQWLFLTGERDALYGLATSGFKLEAMEAPAGSAAPDGPFLHSSKLALVDARSRVRGYYDSTEPDAMERLAADVARAARERR